jgi:large subunit ribosomal protein L21
MFAVIDIKGSQYLVQKGERIRIPRRLGDVGSKVEFDKILLFKEKTETIVGKPYLEDIKVSGIIRRLGKMPKITVFKFIRRENYRRKRGHRQDFTEVEITNIVKGTQQ